MYQAIRRIYVTKPKSSQSVSHSHIVPFVGEEQSYQSKCPIASSSGNNSPRNSTTSSRSSQHHQLTGKTIIHDQSGSAANWKKCLMPLWATLAILGAIALAALGLGIYAAIMLANSSTAATTETVTMVTSTTVSTVTNLLVVASNGAPLNVTTFNWTTNGTTVAGSTNMTGNTANRLNTPFGLFLDSLDTLYITDRNNNRVQKQTVNSWGSTTAAGQSLGTAGATANTLSLPSSTVLDSAGNIYIADTANHRIQCWYNGASSGTTIIGVTGVSGSNVTLLDSPTGIARDSRTGTIYVADSGNNRIMRYTVGSSVGVAVLGGNRNATGNQQLSNPRYLFFDSTTNTLLIANTGANNIVRWTPDTTNWTLVAGSLTGSNGNSTILLNNPSGVTADFNGNVYVADTANHRVQLFLSGQAAGITIAGTTSVSGSSAHLLNEPVSVALDSQSNLYVVDQQNHRIQRFKKL